MSSEQIEFDLAAPMEQIVESLQNLDPHHLELLHDTLGELAAKARKVQNLIKLIAFTQLLSSTEEEEETPEGVTLQ